MGVGRVGWKKGTGLACNRWWYISYTSWVKRIICGSACQTSARFTTSGKQRSQHPVRHLQQVVSEEAQDDKMSIALGKKKETFNEVVGSRSLGYNGLLFRKWGWARVKFWVKQLVTGNVSSFADQISVTGKLQGYYKATNENQGGWLQQAVVDLLYRTIENSPAGFHKNTHWWKRIFFRRRKLSFIRVLL